MTVETHHPVDHSAYFDHNATTPMDPRVLEAMLPFFIERHGNPSSAHGHGRAAREAVENARRQVADLIGGQAREVVFTSSGTEANNAVVYGQAERHGFRGHLMFAALEHPSIRQAAMWAADKGMDLTELDPDRHGRVTADQVAAALRDDTRLVCLMLANNELGTLQPVAEVAAACRERGVPVLCDAVQAVGKIPVDVHQLGVDYLCLGGHKFHGPPGIAALWIRSGATMEPWLLGAPQERGLRASTENVPAVIGLGEAAELARRELEDRRGRLGELRDLFERLVVRRVGARVHCVDSERLPNTSHLAFPGVSGHRLMLWLDRHGFAVSTGSACHSGRPQPSRALLRMGLPADEALASLRVSFGLTNTEDEVRALVAALERGLKETVQEPEIERSA